MVHDEFVTVRKVAAQSHEVSPEIHNEDMIFRFLFEHPTLTKESAFKHYFDDGAKSAHKLKKILTEICGFENKPIELLEFASGYGCVTRHLKNIIPTCIATACDIHPEAIQFIQQHVGSATKLSTTRPEDLHFSQEFDSVFALSFFSHMPKRSFSRWLKRLVSFVKPGGFLIFTTHGLVTQKLCFPHIKYDSDGFYFAPSSEQKDLDFADYGTTISQPQYVLDCIFDIPSLALKHFQEGFWWEHQDVFVVRKID